MSHSTEKITHYSILRVHHRANSSEIKRAYRNLVKQFHPDCNHQINSHDRIAEINVAYEVLSNPQTRASYDRTIGLDKSRPTHTENHHSPSRARRASYVDEDQKLNTWIKKVYDPILELLNNTLDVLDDQIDELADDPFDDELMANFQTYIVKCQDSFITAQALFRHYPNPKSVAGVAAYLYHCLNQLGDGIEELNYFTLNFDDRHLHTGQELWRIANEMRESAQEAMESLAR
jgi:molecular chaperone DnaJ